MNDAEPRAWIGLASNDDHDYALMSALTALERSFGPLTRSSVYASPCVNGCDEREYWNLAAGFNTTLDAAALRAQLKTIEAALGRQRGLAAAGRVRIDLDLLATAGSDGVMFGHDLLEAPHVLLPLAELLPEWRAPEQHFTLVERARRLDTSRLRRLVTPDLIAASGSASLAEEYAC